MKPKELVGKDCMVEAVVSATGNASVRNNLKQKRLEQMTASFGQPLDPRMEANNLQELLLQAGHKGQVQVTTISSMPELNDLAGKRIVFVGFSGGSDIPPHITHLGDTVNGGFESSQQFTSYDDLIQQLMEQGRITVFTYE